MGYGGRATVAVVVVNVFKGDGEGSKAAKEENEVDDAENQQSHLGVSG